MKSVRGTYDLYDKDMQIHNLVVNELKSVVEKYNYTQIKTPIFEETELFKRTTGNSSDIVQKEMYEFLDKGGRSITLRPELTAGFARAFITNKIYGKRLSQYKYFYYGEAFRYERPQSGRFRQFYQFGIEFLEDKTEYSDVEVISLAHNILRHFNLQKQTKLKINTIGNSEERKVYKEKLKEYFTNSESELCEDCKNRLNLNPLRILDCKIDGNKDIVKNAPKLKQFLSENSIKRHEKILTLLNDLNIKYEEDDTLVRGLDYYNDIVFEFIYEDDEEKKTIIGGGRYDGLISQLSNQDVPAIGFGIGVERLIDAFLKANENVTGQINDSVDIFYMPQTEDSFKLMLKSMNKLRMYGLICSGSYTIRSLKSLFKEAEKNDAIYCVILDEESVKDNVVKIKNLITKEETKAKLEDFEDDIMTTEED